MLRGCNHAAITTSNTTAPKGCPVKEWLNTFLSELHRAYLKPRGFRKHGRTLSLDAGTYYLRFNFQGSDSNGLYETWKFYINTGVEFKDLEPETYWHTFAHTHWAVRIKYVVAEAPDAWRYTLNTDRNALAAELVGLIDKTTANVAGDAGRIRNRYLAKKDAQSARFNQQAD